MIALLAGAWGAPCTFTATVTADGAPVTDADVLLARSVKYTNVEEYRAKTDAKGHATFDGLPPGAYAATAAALDRVPGTMKKVTCRSGEALKGSLALKTADSWIEGRLKDKTGRTLDGTVGIVDTTGDNSVFVGPATLDLVDGAYRIPVISGYGYNVYGFSEGYRFGSVGTLQPTAGERKQADIEMSLAATIEGQVFGLDGKPVKGATVYRMPLSTDQATTDAEGRFSLATAPGVLHRVSAISENLVGTTEVGVVQEGEDRYSVRIDLRPGRTVKGQVLDTSSRKPVGPTTVVWGASGTGLVVKVPVASDGSFIARGVPYDWQPDPNVLYQPDQPADHVSFFVHDHDRKAALRKVTLPPSETTIDVPFVKRED